MIKTVALEGAEFGITANAICHWLCRKRRFGHRPDTLYRQSPAHMSERRQ